VAAGVANHESVSAASAVAGASSVSLVLGATSAAENLYADGYVFYIDGDGSGQERRIVSHASASSTGTLTAVLEEPLEDAVTAGDEATLRTNEYKSVVVTPGNAIVAVAGAPQCDIPIGSTTEQFFWLQTWGPAMVVSDATTFVDGGLVTYATSTTDDAGQITATVAHVATVTTDPTTSREIIAVALDPGDASDADYKWINLRINP
jgi:hypothetical protein